MFGLNKIIPSNSNYSFMDLRKKFITASAVLIMISLALLFFKGLNFGVDFKSILSSFKATLAIALSMDSFLLILPPIEKK